MPIQVERIANSPIIIATLPAPIDAWQEAPEMFEAIILLRDSIVGFDRYFVIVDASQATLRFSDLVAMLGESRIARQQRREDFPVSLAVVGSGKLVEMGAQATNQPQYGNYGMRLFTSLESAIETIQSELSDALG
ncbi:MAG: hypothetical protein GYB68_05575 [Chloroflexi bacterium]|nr:hypothetical protein [Chloroflexota bacterium]